LSFYIKREIILKEVNFWLSQADEPCTYQDCPVVANYRKELGDEIKELVKALDSLKL